MITLQARLAESIDNSCALCEHRRDRTRGSMETYLADTNQWVCQDCAFDIDVDLARFAYEGISKAPKNSRFDEFGNCPVCGQSGNYLNVGKNHWSYCPRHGLRWWSGYNLLSSWELETEFDWERNKALLLRMREVEPAGPPTPSWLKRAFGWLQKTLAAVVVSIKTGGEVPF